MSIEGAVHKMEEMGFRLEADDSYIYVTPMGELDPAWRDWLKRHKPQVRTYLVARSKFQQQCVGAALLGRSGLWE